MKAQLGRGMLAHQLSKAGDQHRPPQTKPSQGTFGLIAGFARPILPAMQRAFLFSGPDQSTPIVSLLIADRGPEPITHSTPTNRR
nr:MAG TPA: hypothetical protein [Caudoviricetes sp.]